MIVRIQTYKTEEVIIKKGSYDTCAYIIESGKVEVSDVINNKKIVHAVLGKQQIFGEMGLIEDKPRSATITALEQTELLVIGRNEFNDIFKKKPKILLPIIKALFERLRTANKMLVSERLFVDKKISTTTRDDLDDTATTEYESLDVKSIILSGLNETSTKALDGGKIEISKFPFKVGRQHDSEEDDDVFSDNDLYLNDQAPFNVSRNHFMIYKIEDKYAIVDRGSSFGTIVNDKKIRDICILKKTVNKIIVGSNGSPFVFQLEIV